MKLDEFYSTVARKVDTSGTKINVAETSRVLHIAFGVLGRMPPAAALELIARAMTRGLACDVVKKKKR